MRRLAPKTLTLRPFSALDDDYALLVGGTEEKASPMTVSWGNFGTLWNLPVVTVYVRPTRHTFQLLNEHNEFTLNFLPETHRAAFDVCGNMSGRDGDKWTAAHLKRSAAELVAVPRVAEARMILECRILATFDFDPSRFRDPAVADNYPGRDFHRGYIGQVLGVFAE